MGLVNYTEEAVGTTSDGINVQNIMDAFGVQSAALGQENFREEALQNESFDPADPVAVLEDRNGYGTRTQITNSTPAKLTMGSDVEVTGIVMAANEVLQVTCTMDLPSDPTAGSAATGYGIPDNASSGGNDCVLAIQLYTRLNGGAWTAASAIHEVGDTLAVIAGAGENASIAVSHDITGAGTWDVRCYAWVTVAGAAVNVDNAIIYAIRFKRQT